MPAIELARQDGEEQRSVTLFESGEGVRVHTSDSGPTALEVFGAKEYEFWVDVASADLAALAVALLRERYAGDVRAADHLRDFCDANKVPYRWSTWTSPAD